MHQVKKRGHPFLLPLILLFLAIVLLIIVIWPDDSLERSSYEVTLADNCGRFANLISHTIPDAHTCKVRCQDQCEAKELSLKESVFEAKEATCNGCTCICGKGIWFS